MRDLWKKTDSTVGDDRIFISFSGGRSSAVMTKLLHERYRASNEIIILFANTGCEHEETLKFVDECDRRFGWGVVWLEAVTNQQAGVGVRSKRVDFESASRTGEPFEDSIKKYGIYNATNQQCTKNLKVYPLNDYLKQQGWKTAGNRDFFTAVGIRADEMDRVSQAALQNNKYFYPLVDIGIRKRDVALEIKKWGFDLCIPNDAHGNCVWCWKKSLRKLMTVAKEDSTAFDFPAKMEARYGSHRADQSHGASDDGKMVFFRNYQSANDIVRLSETERFTLHTDDPYDHGISAGLFDGDGVIDDLDVGGGCGDGCEIGADE
jgi:3'-phosphoadenosine 5'-phosphosulfate sulfotransferase (PAPS reductase)/FAD synthetase